MRRVEKYSDLKAGLLIKFISKNDKTPVWVKVRLTQHENNYQYGPRWYAKEVPYTPGVHWVIVKNQFNETKIWYA